MSIGKILFAQVMNARRVYSNKSDRSTGVIYDQSIRLNDFYVSKMYLLPRMLSFAGAKRLLGAFSVQLRRAIKFTL